MNIAHNDRSGQVLVIPDYSWLGKNPRQRDIASIYAEAGFPAHPWIRTRRTKITARRGKGFFSSPDVIETADDIALWEDRWQVGFACCWRTGLIVLDVDEPVEFDDWSLSELVPDTLQVATGREGGYHLYLDFRHLRAAVPAEDWPKQGDIPGGTLKANGFVGAPGSRHPSGALYRVVGDTETVARGSTELLEALVEYRKRRTRRDTGASEPGYLAELLATALKAEEHEQHDAVRNYVNGLEKECSEEAITSLMFPALLERLPNYDIDDPWDMNGLREMFSGGRYFSSYEEERILAEAEPVISGEEGEDEFWNSRPDLATLRQWAQAQMVSPWALLAECLAEVIARVPPTFVLPKIVGTYGTLNMLLAITGDSSAGKSAAAGVAEDALAIHDEFDFMKPERIPIGSGEGLVKNYAFRKDGIVVRSAYTSIPTAYEIDTLNAIIARGGETLTSQLRQFYSGEQLGFGYTGSDKRVMVPKYSYRGVLIAGVQPERSGVIVHDHASGFAQRWMFFSATDPYLPEERPECPEPLNWQIPRGLYELDHEAGKPLEVMQVCEAAAEEILAARRLSLSGMASKEDKLRGHSLLTQEKFAAGLALLAMRTEIADEDWKLAAYATERSDALRLACLSALRKQEYEAARHEGRKDGIRQDASEAMRGQVSDRRLERLVLKHVTNAGKMSRSALSRKIPGRKEEVTAALKAMCEARILIREVGEYNGQNGEWYSSAKKS
jgi:hypothetical protein